MAPAGRPPGLGAALGASAAALALALTLAAPPPRGHRTPGAGGWRRRAEGVNLLADRPSSSITCISRLPGIQFRFHNHRVAPPSNKCSKFRAFIFYPKSADVLTTPVPEQRRSPCASARRRSNDRYPTHRPSSWLGSGLGIQIAWRFSSGPYLPYHIPIPPCCWPSHFPILWLIAPFTFFQITGPGIPGIISERLISIPIRFPRGPPDSVGPFFSPQRMACHIGFMQLCHLCSVLFARLRDHRHGPIQLCTPPIDRSPRSAGSRSQRCLWCPPKAKGPPPPKPLPPAQPLVFEPTRFRFDRRFACRIPIGPLDGRPPVGLWTADTRDTPEGPSERGEVLVSLRDRGLLSLASSWEKKRLRSAAPNDPHHTYPRVPIPKWYNPNILTRRPWKGQWLFFFP